MLPRIKVAMAAAAVLLGPDIAFGVITPSYGSCVASTNAYVYTSSGQSDPKSYGPVLSTPAPASCSANLASNASTSGGTLTAMAGATNDFNWSATENGQSGSGSIAVNFETTNSDAQSMFGAIAGAGGGIDIHHSFQVDAISTLYIAASLSQTAGSGSALGIYLRDITNSGAAIELYRLINAASEATSVALTPGRTYEYQIIGNFTASADANVLPSEAYSGIATWSLNSSLTPVPLPAAAWLLLSGIGGLGAFLRRRPPALAGA